MSAEKTCPSCGQKLPKNEGVAEVRAIWPRCQEVAKHYGREWRTLTPTREATMLARLAEQGSPDTLWQAIHGAVTYWRGLKDFDPLQNLVPETIYRRGQFTKYLERYVAPPLTPPRSALAQRREAPRPDGVLSREEGVRRSAEILGGLTRSITARRAQGQIDKGTR